jgi:hypothetical protein
VGLHACSNYILMISVLVAETVTEVEVKEVRDLLTFVNTAHVSFM